MINYRELRTEYRRGNNRVGDMAKNCLLIAFLATLGAAVVFLVVRAGCLGIVALNGLLK
jgi:hypothetical protein